MGKMFEIEFFGLDDIIFHNNGIYQTG